MGGGKNYGGEERIMGGEMNYGGGGKELWGEERIMGGGMNYGGRDELWGVG